MQTPQVTIKTTPMAARLLRIIAANTGETQYHVLERLIRAELDRLDVVVPADLRPGSYALIRPAGDGEAEPS